MTPYGEDMAISTVNYVQSTRRWYVRTSCVPQHLLVIIFPMPRKRKQQKKAGHGDGDGDDIERCFEEAFEDVVSTRCGGCGNPLAHGSHDCPFCRCPMHAWCGHSMEETHGQVGGEAAKGHGVPRVCQPCFDANAHLHSGSGSHGESHGEFYFYFIFILTIIILLS